MNLYENQRWNQVLRKGKHSLLHMRHPSWRPLCRIKEWNVLMTTISWPTDVISHGGHSHKRALKEFMEMKMYALYLILNVFHSKGVALWAGGMYVYVILFNLQLISGRRIWCFASRFSCCEYWYVIRTSITNTRALSNYQYLH